MKKLLLSLLLVPSLALAQQVNHSVKSTEDNDGVKLLNHTTSVMVKDWGIGVSKTDYQTPTYNKTSSGLLLIADYKRSNHSLVGNIGIGSTSGKNYLLGDITGSYTLNKNISLNASVFGDLIDSTKSLTNNIAARGLILGADLTHDQMGLAAGSKTVWYSDQNKQQGYYLKPFYSIADGVNVYMTKKHYTNSMPYNGLYFSPDVYDRSGMGISVRKRLGHATVYGFVEKTRIKTQFSNDSTTAWKLEVSSPVYDKVKTRVSAGKDYNNGFYYKYLEFSIAYTF